MPFLTFLIAVAYVPGIPSYESAGRWACIAIGGAVLLWKARVQFGPGHLLGLFLLLFCTASIMWSATPLDTLGQSLQLIALATVFCVATTIRDLSKCVIALALGLIPSLLVGIIQYAGYHPVKIYTPQVPGLFLSSNWMASFAAVSLVAAVAYKRYWWTIPGGLLVMMNHSREAFVAVLLTCLIACIRFLPSQRLLWWASFSSGIVVLGGLVVAGLWYTLNYGSSGNSSVNDRLVFWQLGLANITAFGYGLGSSVELWPQFEHFHNEYIEYMFELGFGAFSILGITVYALGSRTPASWPFITLLITCFFNFNLHEPMGAFLFALLAGYLVGDRDRQLGFQSVRRVLTWTDPGRQDTLGVGAVFAVDIRRQMVSVGSQYPQRP